MKAKQLYYILLASLVLLFAGFIGIAYGTNKILGGESKKLSELRANSEALDTQQKMLGKNKQDIIKYGQLNTIAKTIVPQDKDQAEAVREIVNIAGQSGIDKISSITFPTSSLGIALPSTTGSTAKPSNQSLTQLTPVKGMPGLYQLQITVAQNESNRVSYNQFLTFLSKLESNRRTAQVSNINVQPDPKNPSQVAFTLIINEYIKP